MALAASTILQLRVLINDVTATSWNDTQLSQFICVASAQLNTYLQGIGPTFVVDITNLVITPDPSDRTQVSDMAEQLILLLAASLINDSEIKTLYATAGYKIIDDKSTIDTTQLIRGLTERKKLYQTRFDELLLQYKRGQQQNQGFGILSPFNNATY
jgi:hypothetical protein